MNVRRLKHRHFSGLAAVLLAVLAWVAYGAVAERRLLAGLAEAARDMEAGNSVRSRDRLARLAERWPGRAEVLFRLGESELTCGRVEPAKIAWSKVPHGSPFSAQAALGRAHLALQVAQFSDAERILREALDDPGTGAREVWHLLLVILGQQGRLDEARRLIEQRWRKTDLSPSERLALLREHLALDLEPMPLEGNLVYLGNAGATDSDDERLWLARAFLATRSGRLDEASRWLDSALLRRPDDPVLWRARLDWALEAGRLDRAAQAMAHLEANSFSAQQIARLEVWLAAKTGDAKAEKTALEKALSRNPADGAALERLAELTLQIGHEPEARSLRKRKSELDALKDRYQRLFKKEDFENDAVEMAKLAAALGRGFEARAFLTLKDLKNPGDPTVRAELDRLGPLPPPDSIPSGTLAKLFAGALAPSDRPLRPALASATISAVFENAAVPAGLAGFVLDNGQSPIHQLPETTFGGVGVIDYDGDGLLDVYVVQGGPITPPSSETRSGDRLFRNRGDGTFEDVTLRSGISAMAGGHGHGVSVGDIDNDGHPDLFLTKWRSYALYRNRGDGTFEDITGKAGLAGDRDWPTSSAFADLDNDGDVDLYVCHYGTWDTQNPMICKDPTGRVNISCDPRVIAAQPDHVFRNDNGKFIDVTGAAGVVDRDGRGLGVVAADFDGDGLVDIFVANDSTANFLFHNLGGFRFEEVGHSAGVAANAQGGYQAGMGVACGDLDGDGLSDLAVTNFFGESTSFFQNLGKGLFVDHTAAFGLSAPSRHFLGFGAAFLDANNDGRLDLMTANGHVNDMRPFFPLSMTAQLYLGGADRRLTDWSSMAGPPFQEPHVGRALAVGDLDNDGRLDALMVAQNEPLVYFHNRTGGTAGHFITLKLQGTRSNRDGVGAVVTIMAGEQQQVAQRFGGGSYQSAGDQRLHFGLAATDRVASVKVRWPSGHSDLYENLSADKCYRLTEGDSVAQPAQGWRRSTSVDPGGHDIHRVFESR